MENRINLETERDRLGMPRIKDQQYDGNVKVDFSELVSTFNSLINNQFIGDGHLIKLGFTRVDVGAEKHFWKKVLKSKTKFVENLTLISNYSNENDNKFTVEILDTGLGICKTAQELIDLIKVLIK